MSACPRSAIVSRCSSHGASTRRSASTNASGCDRRGGRLPALCAVAVGTFQRDATRIEGWRRAIQQSSTSPVAPACRSHSSRWSCAVPRTSAPSGERECSPRRRNSATARTRWLGAWSSSAPTWWGSSSPTFTTPTSPRWWRGSRSRLPPPSTGRSSPAGAVSRLEKRGRWTLSSNSGSTGSSSPAPCSTRGRSGTPHAPARSSWLPAPQGRPGSTASSTMTAPARRWRSIICTSLGHTHIAHIDGGAGAGAASRRSGFLAAMRRHGLERTAQVVPGDFTEAGGAAGVDAVLAAGELPTCGVRLQRPRRHRGPPRSRARRPRRSRGHIARRVRQHGSRRVGPHRSDHHRPTETRDGENGSRAPAGAGRIGTHRPAPPRDRPPVWWSAAPPHPLEPEPRQPGSFRGHEPCAGATLPTLGSMKWCSVTVDGPT